VSRILLDAITEAPPIAPPHVPGLGSPGAVAGQPVGTVIRVTRVDANEYFVVLADGVQRVGEVAADLIRIAGSQSGRDVVSLAPGALAGVPVVDTLPVSGLPRRAGTPRGKGGGVLCAQWLDSANTVLWLDDSPPESDAVDFAQADGDGPNLDTAVIPAGRSAYVRATSLTGEGRRTGPLYLVTDSGVLFGIRDEDAAAHLGLGGSPAAAPWPVLSRLPRGPELSREAALIAHDGIGAPP
jgi:type VII secretion protein EccB